VSADYRPVSGRHLSQPTARAVLRTIVREAAERARTPEEFFDALQAAGVRVRPRFGERNPGQVTGYAVTFPEHRSADGEELWYGGGRLADDLTWSRLRERWRGDSSRPVSGGAAAEFTAEEVRALYEDAARAAAYATAQLRRYSVINPYAARDACWAAADALNVVAAVTGNRDLRRAADAYDRAARPPYGRIPAPTAAGDGLRTAARLLAMAGRRESRAGGVTSLVVKARGRPGAADADAAVGGTIPACAGPTRRMRRPCPTQADHPRVRGADDLSSAEQAMDGGPSPRARGRRGLLDKILGGAVPGAGIIRDVVAQIPSWIKDTVLKWVTSKVDSGVGGPAVQRALRFAKAQAGKPYIWGGVGPGGYDCSGFMSAITNVIQGRSPYSRRFTTFSFTGARQGPAGFVRNLRSGFVVGVTNAGVGHMAGTLGGVNVESRGSAGVVVGPRARGAGDGLFSMRYGLRFNKGGVVPTLYDDGGWLPPGLHLVANRTRRPEPILPPGVLDALVDGRSGGSVEYHAHFDGLTRGAIERQVRAGIQAEAILAAQRDRTGRRR